ncbi:MAG: DUF1405 domain-containing protein [Chloroflexi bacterium]|nr:DUF1405 domain-containing protein [Chloroflexota bacterium]
MVREVQIGRVIAWLQRLLRLPPVMAAVLIADMTGFVWGILYWYGRQLPGTPVWSWPFIPDCPLFGLVGGLALLLVVAQDASPRARSWMRAALWIVGASSLVAMGVAAWAGGRASPLLWARWIAAYEGMWALLGGLCLITAAVWNRVPNEWLSIAAMGQIKYGLWTVFAWVVFWWNTRGFVTFESVFMTVTHMAMIAQGMMLFTYYRPSRRGALVAGGWFLLSDFVDYGLGYYPRLPRQVPVSVMQWHTIPVTFILTAAFWRLSRWRDWPGVWARWGTASSAARASRT